MIQVALPAPALHLLTRALADALATHDGGERIGFTDAEAEHARTLITGLLQIPVDSNAG